jgi:hypothetical protein
MKFVSYILDETMSKFVILTEFQISKRYMEHQLIKLRNRPEKLQILTTTFTSYFQEFLD